ncbi:MAG: hypothetical protein AAGF56_05820 [Pseudomonadota bacterium]
MLISHRHRFVVFPDPLDVCPYIRRALDPWIDRSLRHLATGRAGLSTSTIMTPTEVARDFPAGEGRFDDYTRIAILQDPYQRMAQLYHMICHSDRYWQLRQDWRFGVPSFDRWLAATRPFGRGAGHILSPRWRRHGAWAAEPWCAGHVTHVARAEAAADDLSQIFRLRDIAPSFSCRDSDQTGVAVPDKRIYTQGSVALIEARYAVDLRLRARSRLGQFAA